MKNRKRRERYHQKKAGKSDFAFLNSVLPFLVYLIYNAMWYWLELIRPRKALMSMKIVTGYIKTTHTIP